MKVVSRTSTWNT